MVQARLVYLAPPQSRGFFATADFAQITMRTVSIQSPVLMPVKRSKQAFAHAELAGDHQEWRAAVSSSGHLYYYHPETSAVTWRRPPSFGTVCSCVSSSVALLMHLVDHKAKPLVLVMFAFPVGGVVSRRR
jgi:hypothetical protein